MNRNTVHNAFEVDNEKLGCLTIGDEFEFQITDAEGANWGAFIFYGHIVTPKGSEWINAYGGDPIRPINLSGKSNTGHRRQWHAFPMDRVRAEAQPIRAQWRSKRA